MMGVQWIRLGATIHVIGVAEHFPHLVKPMMMLPPVPVDVNVEIQQGVVQVKPLKRSKLLLTAPADVVAYSQLVAFLMIHTFSCLFVVEVAATKTVVKATAIVVSHIADVTNYSCLYIVTPYILLLLTHPDSLY